MTPVVKAAVPIDKSILRVIALNRLSGIKKATSSEMASSLGLYVKRWQRWAAAGLQGIRLDVYVRNLSQQVPIQIEL